MLFTSSGQPDVTFGVSGRTSLAWAAGGAFLWASPDDQLISVQPGTGRILIVSSALTTLPGLPVRTEDLHAYTAQGTPDLTFGVGGVLTRPTPPAGVNWVIAKYALAADGTIAAAGTASVNGAPDDVAVFRFTRDGLPDPSFGTGGTLVIDLANRSSDSATGLLMDQAGRIVVSGGIQTDTYILRLIPNGSFDPTFGTNGMRVTHSNLTSSCRRMVETGAGDLVCSTGTTMQAFAPDGADKTGFVPIFGMQGSAFTPPLSWDVLSEGSIVVAGDVDHGFPTYNDFVLWRYSPLGLPDETFADHGTTSFDFGAADDVAAVAVRPDGRILVVGAVSARAGVASTAHVGVVGGKSGIIAQALGGSRTGLKTSVAPIAGGAKATLRRKKGRAIWKPVAILTCKGTPLGGGAISLEKRRGASTWKTVATAISGGKGTATVSLSFKLPGTSFFRWKFAATPSYLGATSAQIKVVVQ